MKNEFYEYVKQKIQNLPCSGYLDLSTNHIVLENDFVDYICKKYIMLLINFERESQYSCFPISIRDEQKISDNVIYHFKLNNQLYLEYMSCNDNTIESSDYSVKNIKVYSSETNQKELIEFLEYIDNYIKTINK